MVSPRYKRAKPRPRGLRKMVFAQRRRSPITVCARINREEADQNSPPLAKHEDRENRLGVAAHVDENYVSSVAVPDVGAGSYEPCSLVDTNGAFVERCDREPKARSPVPAAGEI
jgi:hypothetical protein